MSKKISRKDFIKTSTVAGVGLSVLPFNIVKGKDNGKVRLGFIGVGGRGRSHLAGALARDDISVRAICDINKENADRAQEMVRDAGMDEPELYTRGETDFRRMLKRDDLDGVFIATPWLWHVPMAVAAMEAGIYTGLEVPIATTVDGCWELVETSERTGIPCMMLENVCYRRDVMAILNMVRKGMFGELTHARCGYQHNLLPVLLDENGNFGPGTVGESEWRTYHHINRNGDLYPTHGIGPVAHWLDINKGNRFLKISSHATKAEGLHKRIVELGGKDHPNASIEFKKGDVVTSTITTAREETIIVTHNTSSVRPYSLGFRCQGTNGLWQVDGNTIYLDGVSEKHDQWEPFEPYQEKYDHPLWKKYHEEAVGSGHGGMDFFVRNAFIEAIKRQVNTPMDVYDGAAWSVIGPLSEASIEQGGAPVSFPDFTDGRWMKREPDFALESSEF